MRSFKKSEKSQKVSQNDLFSALLKKKFLYEDEKKFVHKTPFSEAIIFSRGKVFSQKTEINDESAEKASNSKETLLKKRASFNRIKFKTHSNNSLDLTVRRVNCYRRRTTSNEKQEYRNSLFNKEYITNDIFCEFFI